MLKACPKCGSTVFNYGHSVVQNNVGIEINDSGFTINPTDTTSQSEQKLLVCVQCNEKFDLNNPQDINRLIDYQPKVKCVKCGREFNPEEVDENGVCDICRMAEKFPAINNMSQLSEFDIQRLIAKMYTENEKLSNTNQKYEEQLKKAEEVHQKEAEAETEDTADESEQEAEANAEPVPKKKRKRRTKAEMEAARIAESAAKTAKELVELEDSNTEDNSDVEIANEVVEEDNSGVEIKDDVAPDINIPQGE